ncbi:cerebellin-3-like isoform X3 [Saccostrea cucullata]|uniref:cerebellin-3-like isoform X3 n=1 Tax=Saccostrea cuccullata TaxID=36930 RepID=UPI002ED5BC90
MAIPNTKSQILYKFEEENRGFVRKMKNLEREILRLQEEMVLLTKENQMNEKAVTFSATADDNVSQTITRGGEVIILKRVLNNVGGGYDSETGVFTAPVAGNYAFFFSVEVTRKKRLKIFLYVNNNHVAEAIAGVNEEYFDTGSNMVTLSLQKNDRVCIKSHPNNAEMVDIQYCGNSFTGFLLSPK